MHICVSCVRIVSRATHRVACVRGIMCVVHLPSVCCASCALSIYAVHVRWLRRPRTRTSWLQVCAAHMRTRTLSCEVIHVLFQVTHLSFDSFLFRSVCLYSRCSVCRKDGDKSKGTHRLMLTDTAGTAVRGDRRQRATELQLQGTPVTCISALENPLEAAFDRARQRTHTHIYM